MVTGGDIFWKCILKQFKSNTKKYFIKMQTQELKNLISKN